MNKISNGLNIQLLLIVVLFIVSSVDILGSIKYFLVSILVIGQLLNIYLINKHIADLFPVLWDLTYRLRDLHNIFFNNTYVTDSNSIGNARDLINAFDKKSISEIKKNYKRR